jgi:glycosyltransferase involved in cell wall biosynthesis
MSTKPYISVIIPTHLRPLYLRRAIESINMQAFRDNIEIIVVSDCHDSETCEVANSLLSQNDIFIRRNGINGPSASRNIGINLAKGSFLMFLDDDDSWHPDFLTNLFNHLPVKNHPISYMNSLVIKESRPATGPIFISEKFLDFKDSLNNNVFVKNQIHMSCFLFSSHTINDLKFDTHMRAYEDWDFQLFAIERYFPKHLPILSSCVYEVDDDTSDRRGASENAKDFNAVMDYLYVYRRHASPSVEIALKRKELLYSCGIDIPFECL